VINVGDFRKAICREHAVMQDNRNRITPVPRRLPGNSLRLSPAAGLRSTASGLDGGTRRAQRWLVWLVACSLTLSQSGCSLFVMAGKMVFGDPQMNSEFLRSTGVDLGKGKHRVMVVASLPAAVKVSYPSVELDLQDEVTRRLSRQGVQVVNADDVGSWMDDHGGVWDSVDALAQDFDVDYIVHIRAHRFDHKEYNSQDLFRGRAQGDVIAYQVVSQGERRRALGVFTREFSSEHPRNFAVSVDEKSESVFQKEFLDHLSHELAMRFYSHRMSEEIE